MPTARFGSAELSIEERGNGYLIEILTENPVGDVATLITPGNWLIVTIADTLLDTASVAGYRSAMVDSTLAHRFGTATQFSLRFMKPISSAEILREARRRNILISVFF